MPEGLFADPASGPALASRGSRVSWRFLQQLPPGHGGPRHWRFGPPPAQGPRARLAGHDHWSLARHGCRRQSPGPDWRHDCRSPRCTVRSPPADETSNPPGDGRGEGTRLAAPARSCRGAVVKHDGSTRDRPIVVSPTCSKPSHIIAIRLRPSFNLNPHPAFGHPLPAGEGQNLTLTGVSWKAWNLFVLELSS